MQGLTPCHRAAVSSPFFLILVPTSPRGVPSWALRGEPGRAGKMAAPTLWRKARKLLGPSMPLNIRGFSLAPDESHDDPEPIAVALRPRVHAALPDLGQS